MKINIVITGRFYHEADDVPASIEMPDGSSVDEALRHLDELLGESSLPASCLVALSGEHLGTVATHSSSQLSDGDELTLVTPVAGG